MSEEDVDAVFGTGVARKCRCQALKVEGWIWTDSTQEEREAAETSRLTYREALPDLVLTQNLDVSAPSFTSLLGADISLLDHPALVCQRAKYLERKEKNRDLAVKNLPIPMDWTLCSQK